MQIFYWNFLISYDPKPYVRLVRQLVRKLLRSFLVTIIWFHCTRGEIIKSGKYPNILSMSALISLTNPVQLPRLENWLMFLPQQNVPSYLMRRKHVMNAFVSWFDSATVILVIYKSYFDKKNDHLSVRRCKISS